MKMNPFDRFYDTKISVYSEKNENYGNDGQDTFLGRVLCDIQPYYGDMDNDIYGFSDNKAYKLYCGHNNLLVNGRRVKIGGEWYRIVRAEIWKLGMCALIRGI